MMEQNKPGFESGGAVPAHHCAGGRVIAPVIESAKTEIAPAQS